LVSGVIQEGTPVITVFGRKVRSVNAKIKREKGGLRPKKREGKESPRWFAHLKEERTMSVLQEGGEGEKRKVGDDSYDEIEE